jgi:hypothetical protein
MAVTDPRATASAVELRDQHQTLVEAVHDLYRACHLPAPTVPIAPSAPEFMRIVLALGREWWLVPTMPLMLLVGSAFALALGFATLRDIILEEGLRSTRISLLVTVFVSSLPYRIPERYAPVTQAGAQVGVQLD